MRRARGSGWRRSKACAPLPLAGEEKSGSKFRRRRRNSAIEADSSLHGLF
jgi:hypothetical protein